MTNKTHGAGVGFLFACGFLLTGCGDSPGGAVKTEVSAKSKADYQTYLSREIVIGPETAQNEVVLYVSPLTEVLSSFLDLERWQTIYNSAIKPLNGASAEAPYKVIIRELPSLPFTMGGVDDASDLLPADTDLRLFAAIRCPETADRRAIFENSIKALLLLKNIKLDRAADLKSNAVMFGFAASELPDNPEKIAEMLLERALYEQNGLNRDKILECQNSEAFRTYFTESRKRALEVDREITSPAWVINGKAYERGDFINALEALATSKQANGAE